MKATLRAVAIAAGLAVTAGLAGSAEASNSCGGQTHINACGLGSNIYPCCDNGGNCTWWAWESACRNWHTAPNYNWNNAKFWAGHAVSDPNYDVIGYPVPGSIATRKSGDYGHVAWVLSTSGSSVTVSEENCCDSCAGGVRNHTYASGYFDSGYVIRAGSLCECSGGATQTEACGDCGTRTRSCDGCGWGGWGACNGPDPEGGTLSCDSGGLGACTESRIRCVAGNKACRSIVEPSAEVCDGVDNDCNGIPDDGHPQEFGPVLPDYAAKKVDVSYPSTLKPGERATMWVEFRNVGKKTWPIGGVWLGAHGSTTPEGKDGASALLVEGSWPAYNVAASLDHVVAPGEVGRFAFEVQTNAQAGLLAEKFQLEVAGGAWIGCPDADFAPEIQVLTTSGAGPSPTTPATQTGSSGGCSTSAGSSNGAWIIALLLGAISRRSRSKR